MEGADQIVLFVPYWVHPLAPNNMLQTGFKVAQRVPLSTTHLVPYRSLYSLDKPISSLFTLIRRKWNKTFKGTENPLKQKDVLLEKIIEEEKYYLPAHLARTFYLREHARKNYLKHNERIRELEHKVTGGVYKVKGFANKF